MTAVRNTSIRDLCNVDNENRLDFAFMVGLTFLGDEVVCCSGVGCRSSFAPSTFRRGDGVEDSFWATGMSGWFCLPIQLPEPGERSL